MKNLVATIILLILLSVSFASIPLSNVQGQLGVNIILVSPQEEGKVGQEVNLQGTIETANGEYQIWFDSELVASNNSEGYYVNANFTLPELSAGNYVITLRDFSKNINATYPFAITVAYEIEATELSPPALLQEGGDVILNVKVTGIQSGVTHRANVTVELPAPLSTSYSQIIELASSSTGAVATGRVTFPSGTFQPEGSMTTYTGSYHVYFNKTEQLAESQFFVGFTDSSEYHRSQSVVIRAIGYQPNENATLSIKYKKTSAIVYSETLTASSDGVIDSSWMVPSDVLIGDYNITITPDNTAKLVTDSQLFTVPGYQVDIQTLNLAGETVSLIVLEAVDQSTGTLYNATSRSDGIASLNLEKGNHTLSAFWNDVKVGGMNVTITAESTIDLTCELTNLKITVQDKNENLIAFVDLDITYQYFTTEGGLLKTGQASGQTNPDGTFTLHSVLPGISYTINASLYDVVFNSGNNTVTGLPARPLSEVAILCPTRTLTLKIIDFNRAAIPIARIELIEVTNGLFHGDVTNDAGSVTVEVTFGKYRLRIYKNDILLNETVIEVFTDKQNEILCSLYNIKVSVTVVDYFGQHIPNINVMLQVPGIGTRSATTQVDGTATFNNVIGGTMQIIAYPERMENSYEAMNLQIEEPTTVQIKMDRYILLGPFLIESSVLATIVIILLAVILFVSIEVYRRKLAKSTK